MPVFALIEKGDVWNPDAPSGGIWPQVACVDSFQLQAKDPSVPLETFQVVCPYCFESVDIDVESDVEGSFVQDCEVCCQPWQVNVMGAIGQRQIDVQRAQ